MADPTKINRYTSTALVDELLERNSLLKRTDAEIAVSRVFDSLSSLMGKTERVRVANFGTFTRKYREGRTGRNPRTGETVQIAGREVLTFKPTKAS